VASQPNIEIIEEKLLAGVVADEIAASIQDAVSERGECSLALAGGRTPGSIYRSLSKPPRVGEVEWDKVKIFWGDERWVAPDDTQSNYNMVRETLLSVIPQPGPKIFPIPTSGGSAADGADKYERILKEEITDKASSVPIFDIVLLGIGEDGHTASIFPGSPVVKEKKRLVVDVTGRDGGPDRITLTPKVLFSARKIFFIARGEAKSSVVQRALEGDESPDQLPARLFVHCEQQVSWFLDSSAALKLSN